MATNRSKRQQKLVDEDSTNYDNNFDAGQSKVNEDSLHKTGIRGTKVWIFIAVLVILLLLCIINLIILGVVYGVIKINKDGVDSLSFFENGMLRFTQPSDFQTVTAYGDEIGGFSNRDFDLETTHDSITLHGGPTTKSSQVYISNTNTSITAKRGFKFVDPYAKKEVISFDGSNSLFLHESVIGQDVNMETIRSSRIVSNENQDLTLTSDQSILVHGSEGIDMDGKAIVLDSKTDVNTTSSKGIRMESVEFMLKPKSSKQKTLRLCICRQSGLLFTSESPSSCLVGSNPC